MKKSPLVLLLVIFTTLQFQIRQSNSQQTYVNNSQLDCNHNYNNTYGFQCNGRDRSCTSYVTFRSLPPSYDTPRKIAFLLNSSAPAIGHLNNISELDPIPVGRLIVVPITCSCSRNNNNTYYQHNARYRLQNLGETYFSIANNTYQGLTTCQAMKARNWNRNRRVPDEVLVPLMCACPTARQERLYRSRYLLSYLVTWGDSISQIAQMFGADQQTVLDANELRIDDVIFPFTPLLVPLTSAPTHINLPSTPSEQSTPENKEHT